MGVPLNSCMCRRLVRGRLACWKAKTCRLRSTPPASLSPLSLKRVHVQELQAIIVVGHRTTGLIGSACSWAGLCGCLPSAPHIEVIPKLLVSDTNRCVPTALLKAALSLNFSPLLSHLGRSGSFLGLSFGRLCWDQRSPRTADGHTPV